MGESQNEIPTVRIDKITFADGTELAVGSNSIVAICGPNNAGKSAALKNAMLFLETGRSQTVVRDIKITKIGSASEVLSLVKSSASVESDQGSHRSYAGLGFSLLGFTIEHSWNSENLGDLTKFFAILLKTEDRITDCNPANAIPLITTAPTHPIHIAQRDSRVEDSINKVFNKAFGQEFAIHYGGGSKVPIYVGEKPKLKRGEHLQTHSYVTRFEAGMSPLDGQGDGIRSFSSIALRVLASPHTRMIFIDEPEAFLHPPQAKLLAKFLGNELPADTQIILATHSTSILQGLLDQNKHDVSIVRISRQGNVNKTRVLDSEQLRLSWADPLIRNSNVLDGIFHRHVCVCEADSDCVFYGQILNAIEGEEASQLDVLFTHANGKHGAIKAAAALRAVEVPVSLILDIDVLNDEQTFRKAFETMGGLWSDVSEDWKSLKKSIDKLRPSVNRTTLVKRINDHLEKSEDESVDTSDIRFIRSLLRESSAWSVLKSGGRQMIPSGMPTKNFKALEEKCRALRLWIVPVGELESFYKAEDGGHGPAWLRNVLENADFSTSDELEAARTFMKGVRANF